MARMTKLGIGCWRISREDGSEERVFDARGLVHHSPEDRALWDEMHAYYEQMERLDTVEAA